MDTLLERALVTANQVSNYELRGSVTDMTGLIIEGTGPLIPIGSQVSITSGTQLIPAQVVGFRSDRILLMPFSEPEGIAPGATIVASEGTNRVSVCEGLQGRVIDALGNALDGQPLPVMEETVPLLRDPPNPVTRTRISRCLDLGVRAMNGLLTVGEGQRVGIMAGSGVGNQLSVQQCQPFAVAQPV